MTTRMTVADLVKRTLYRGVDDGQFESLRRRGRIAPPQPIGSTFGAALKSASDLLYVYDHVRGRAAGKDKRAESFSFTRAGGIKYATHEGQHDGWLLSVAFAVVTNSRYAERSQAGRPWLFHDGESIWVLPNSIPTPRNVADLFKTDGDYDRERGAFETLPQLVERQRREQQAARDGFEEWRSVNACSTDDDEVLLVFGAIPIAAFHVERIVRQ